MDVSSVVLLMDPLYSVAAPLAHYRCPKHTPTARYSQAQAHTSTSKHTHTFPTSPPSDMNHFSGSSSAFASIFSPLSSQLSYVKCFLPSLSASLFHTLGSLSLSSPVLLHTTTSAINYSSTPTGALRCCRCIVASLYGHTHTNIYQSFMI